MLNLTQKIFEVIDQSLKLRLLLISIVVVMVPFILYLMSLALSILAFREVEKEFQKIHYLQVDELIRDNLREINRTADYISNTPEVLQTLDLLDGTLLHQVHGHYLKKEYEDLDFASLYREDMKVLHLYFREVVSDSDSNEIIDLCKSLPDQQSERDLAGFGKKGGELYMLVLKPLHSDSHKGFLILGVHVGSTLSSRITNLTPRDVQVSLVDSETAEGTRKDHPENPQMEIDFPLRGFDGKRIGLLKVVASRGILSRIEALEVWFAVLFFLAFAVAGIGGTTWATRMVVSPVTSLNKVMAEVKGPETYNHRAPVIRHDEIGQLTESFNHLMQRLQEAHEELKKEQKKSLEIERLETVHQMVITLAHQINNPLTGLIGRAELVIASPDLSPDDRRSVETILAMGKRIADVIGKLQNLERIETTSYLERQKMIDLEGKRS